MWIRLKSTLSMVPRCLGTYIYLRIRPSATPCSMSYETFVLSPQMKGKLSQFTPAYVPRCFPCESSHWSLPGSPSSRILDTWFFLGQIVLENKKLTHYKFRTLLPVDLAAELDQYSCQWLTAARGSRLADSTTSNPLSGVTNRFYRTRSGDLFSPLPISKSCILPYLPLLTRTYGQPSPMFIQFSVIHCNHVRSRFSSHIAGWL